MFWNFWPNRKITSPKVVTSNFSVYSRTETRRVQIGDLGSPGSKKIGFLGFGRLVRTFSRRIYHSVSISEGIMKGVFEKI